MKCGQKICFQNSPKIMQKLIASIYFSTGIVDIDPMKCGFNVGVQSTNPMSVNVELAHSVYPTIRNQSLLTLKFPILHILTI